jgi:excisionase family DNA binding protein
MTAKILNLDNKQTGEKEDDILTLKEASTFLKVTTRMLYDLVQRRRIPFFKVGRLLRFSKKSLLEWMQRAAQSGH